MKVKVDRRGGVRRIESEATTRWSSDRRIAHPPAQISADENGEGDSTISLKAAGRTNKACHDLGDAPRKELRAKSLQNEIKFSTISASSTAHFRTEVAPEIQTQG
jgi:hypothetical protein